MCNGDQVDQVDQVDHLERERANDQEYGPGSGVAREDGSGSYSDSVGAGAYLRSSLCSVASSCVLCPAFGTGESTLSLYRTRAGLKVRQHTGMGIYARSEGHRGPAGGW